MQYITTTQLRTDSSKLIETLRSGQGVTLIHRSKVIGKVEPAYEPKPFNAKKFENLLENIHLPKTSNIQREKIYNSHLKKKYGQGLS